MKSGLTALAYALALGCSTATAAEPLQPRDLFGLSLASAPAVRPDGSLIAYVRTANDVMTDTGRKSIWLVGSHSGAETLVAGGEGGAAQPTWSPDGSRLAYVQTDAKGAAAIQVYDVTAKTNVVAAKLARSPGRLAWSPDGGRIAFVMAVPRPDTMFGKPLVAPEGAKWAEPLQVIDTIMYRDDGIGPRKPGFSHIFVVPAIGGSPVQVTSGDFDDDGPLSWMLDGSGIVFLGKRSADGPREPFHAGIYRVKLTDGSLTELAAPDQPHSDAQVSPDGRHIAFIGYVDTHRSYENARLSVMDSDGRHVRTLAATLDRSLERPQWSADGRSIYAAYADHGVTKVARIDVATGKLVDVATGLAGEGFDLPYSGGGFAIGRDGTLAFTQGAADHPADLAVIRGGKLTRLTRLNDGLLAQRALGEVKPLTVKSSFDGADIDAWLVLPPGFDRARKYPLILEIHGGPFASYGPSFASDGQLYASSGYVVVYANPRGSTSYGDSFANGIDKSYPGTDYDDLMSVVDAAIAQGFVDKDRLFVTGGSGGGVLTTWIVGKTHRFRAAVAQKPVVNWSSEILTSDIYPWMEKYWFGKQAWEDPQGYWARSPLSLVGNVTTPTMVIVGGDDVRTPVSESEQYYGALQLRGVPTALVKVPGAFHDMALRPSHAAAKASAVLAWFARYGGAIETEK
jgi:dipeptidyl aminopeptidase/acylaminoacyl peptidase